MSRIGEKNINIPAGVTVSVKEDLITVKGSKGELTYTHPDLVKVEVKENEVNCTRENDSREAKSFHGLVRSLVNNMVIGVSIGYERKLQIIGVGYRAEVKGKSLILSLGYSHPIDFPIPEGITITSVKEKNDTIVSVSGISKELVGQVAASIRKFRKPEPYKGKGVRYVGEYVARKEGKRVGA